MGAGDAARGETEEGIYSLLDLFIVRLGVLGSDGLLLDSECDPRNINSQQMTQIIGWVGGNAHWPITKETWPMNEVYVIELIH